MNCYEFIIFIIALLLSWKHSHQQVPCFGQGLVSRYIKLVIELGRNPGSHLIFGSKFKFSVHFRLVLPMEVPLFGVAECGWSTWWSVLPIDVAGPSSSWRIPSSWSQSWFQTLGGGNIEGGCQIQAVSELAGLIWAQMCSANCWVLMKKSWWYLKTSGLHDDHFLSTFMWITLSQHGSLSVGVLFVVLETNPSGSILYLLHSRYH